MSEEMTNSKPDALPVVAWLPCWSCENPVTLSELADADGICPHCDVEIDLSTYLDSALKKIAHRDAELAELREQNAYLQRTIDGMNDAHANTVEELVDRHNELVLCRIERGNLQAELTTLRARLAELEQQEPVRLELRDRFGDWSLCTQEVFDQYESYHRGEGQPASEWPVRKLYAAPVPTPSQVADGVVQVPRELAFRVVKGDPTTGANAIQLNDAWNAMDELRALLATSQEQAK